MIKLKNLPRLLKQVFRRKLKSFLVDDSHKVTEAFTYLGETYYCFEDTFRMPSGRGLQALTIYEEFNMRVNQEYLGLHVRAMEKLFSDPKAINLQAIMLLNQNLKDRMALAVFPDHLYKLASVIYFDKSESPFSYDQIYNEKKIEKWKRAGGALDFFMRTPLKDLIPSMDSLPISAEMYFHQADKVDQLTRSDLHSVLYKVP